ncbi:unnamed protein product [Callosobruchus maculatus]|uniref:Uncharacterized protein n=1 Tax=Callosobruchus maculatus TaxID=64391 RepID=A0A653D7N2_CALMS|nr:unnamed protein product [Callosobruchus maculatus]
MNKPPFKRLLTSRKFGNIGGIKGGGAQLWGLRQVQGSGEFGCGHVVAEGCDSGLISPIGGFILNRKLQQKGYPGRLPRCFEPSIHGQTPVIQGFLCGVQEVNVCWSSGPLDVHIGLILV